MDASEEEWLARLQTRYEMRERHEVREGGRDAPSTEALVDYDMLMQKLSSDYHDQGRLPPLPFYQFAVRLLKELKCQGDEFKMNAYIQYQYKYGQGNSGSPPKACCPAVARRRLA